ncbi:MAG TPA: hypothetical protein VGY66_34155 [Gemmataceae bacterium]|jgi:hypothetical protein|nr:hypothetical protein [Gemmataceae bacterium]
MALSREQNSAKPLVQKVATNLANFNYPPGSKSVANWQTHFFLGRNVFVAGRLWRKLSLPTVANSPGKLANSKAVFEPGVDDGMRTIVGRPRAPGRPTLTPLQDQDDFCLQCHAIRCSFGEKKAQRWPRR